MLKTIPKKILTHSAILKVLTATDRWGSPTYQSYNLSKVHFQNVHTVVKTSDDRQYNLTGLLFYDCRISQPSLDWESLFGSSALANGQMKVEYLGKVYTVYAIDLLPDDEGKLHHVEVSLY